MRPVQIRGVLIRVFVQNLEQSLEFYQRLTGEKAKTSFKYGQLEIAAVGRFLLIAGPDEATAPFRATAGTLDVDELEALEQVVTAAGGQVLIPPQRVPTGRNMTLRHPDGAVFEYVERKPATDA